MTVTTPITPAAEPLPARLVPTRAAQPDSPAHERFLLLRGGPGSGTTGALAALAEDARSEGLDVVELRAGGGGFGVAPGSLDALVALLRGAQVPPVGGWATASERPGLVLVDVDDDDRLAAAELDGVVVRPEPAQAHLRAGRPRDALAVLLHAADAAAPGAARRRARDAALPVATFLGDFATADDLLAGPDAPSGAVAGAAIGFLRAVRSGRVQEARRGVLRGLQDHRGADGPETDLLVATLQMLTHLDGAGEAWDEAIRAAAGRDLDPVLRLVEDCLEPGGAGASDRLLQGARGSLEGGEPWKVVSLHVAWSLLDPLDPRRALLDELLAAPCEDGTLPGLLAVYRRAVAGFQAGRLDDALQDLVRARASAVALRAETIVAVVDSFSASIHAMRGDTDEVAERAGAARRWALGNSAPLVARGADQARAGLDLALGRYEEAYARIAADRPTITRWIHHGYGPVELLDAVQAATRIGLGTHARALVEAAERAAGRHPSPRQALILAAARAVLDEDGSTRERFETALRTVATTDAPFDTARVHLAFGEWLRRDMHALDARLHLRLAETTFESLGAEQWRLRAQRELRAAGGGDAVGRRPDGPDLSEQERRVASLAAAGLSNKQIASRLYLSPRTVSGHLYRIFPKLGVTSRAGLRDALSSLEDGAASAP